MSRRGGWSPIVRFVIRQLATRRQRMLALGVSLLVAATSFTLLVAGTRTSSVELRGTVKSNFRPAYDILVRPRGSKAELERTRGLVRPNYLSGVFGGITLAQYRKIGALPGVDVAAPIANIGYVMMIGYLPVRINDLVARHGRQLFEITASFRGQRGLSTYPDLFRGAFVYYTADDRFLYSATDGVEEIRPGSAPVFQRIQPICGQRAFRESEQTAGPFDPTPPSLDCFSGRSPGEGSDVPVRRFNDKYLPRGFVGASLSAMFPVLVAAIDPAQEARLVGLDRAVVAGRFLRDNDRPRLHRPPSEPYTVLTVPVIAATKTFVDESLVADVRRLQVPAGGDLRDALASEHTWSFLERLHGVPVATRTYPLGPAYVRMLDQILGNEPRNNYDAYWTSGSVAYRQGGANTLRPLPIENPLSIWESPVYQGGYTPAPADNRDLQFRRLTPYTGNNHVLGSQRTLATPAFRVVGRYDPTQIRGFAPLSRVPLETYYPPALEPADRSSARLLGGRPLLPTQNVGDYIEQPPLMLTTLKGLAPFLGRPNFDGPRRTAPISSIRIRVKGAVGPDEVSLARVRQVAAAIHDATGLDVDVTAGSSPHPLRVQLPAGRFGRPPLLLREGWSKKGVSVTFLKALDRKDAALFSLILLVGGVFVSNAAFATVRTRRAEIGTLRTLGWSSRAIFWAILAEVAVIAIGAGVLGAGVALVAARVLELGVSSGAALAVVPVALAVALPAGAIPAWQATRGTPLDAILPPSVAVARARRVRGLVAMALVNLARAPMRTLVGIVALVTGVFALTVLVAIERGFRGSVVGTLLGNALSVKVRPADFFAVSVILVFAGASVADVLYLNLRERSGELATLRAVGWTNHQLRFVASLEGIVVGAAGSICGAALGAAVGAAALHAAAAPLVEASLIAAAGGIAAGFLATLIPMSQVARLTPAEALAFE